MSEEAEADFIIIGAGSAGCVLADRLSASGARVLLLEAGPPARSPLISVPAGVLPLLGHPLYDWRYTSEPVPGTGGRRQPFPRGRTLGGTSAINGMAFVRGHPADFDGWAQTGCLGWSYEDVLPHFKAIESYEGGDDAYRGREGPLTVSDYATILPLTHRFVEAAQQAGFPLMPDLNGATAEGVGYSQQTRHGRFRDSTATSFLAQARKRPNLRVGTEALVTRLLFEGRRCVGVAYRRYGEALEARAGREVILSGGSVNSPQLLQISGIGPAAHLRSIGVTPLHDLPGVGGNLSDHYQAPISARLRDIESINQVKSGLRLGWEALRYVVTGKGALTFGATTASVFAHSREGLAAPDLQLLFFPGSFRPDRPRATLEAEPGMRVSVSIARPDSRGTIMARSPDPADAPAIQPNYLSAESDLRTVVAGMRLTRRIFAAPALATHFVAETLPGRAVEDDVALEAHIRKTGGTVHHLAGTCKMGIDDRAVVDARLKVHGIGGLRVIDASIMPVVTSGNINAPTIMIGEKGAAMVLEGR